MLARVSPIRGNSSLKPNPGKKRRKRRMNCSQSGLDVSPPSPWRRYRKICETNHFGEHHVIKDLTPPEIRVIIRAHQACHERAVLLYPVLAEANQFFPRARRSNQAAHPVFHRGSLKEACAKRGLCLGFGRQYPNVEEIKALAACPQASPA